MTAAQKTAKANFKKAIEYRKKTGCTLKQAFAHVYGSKSIKIKKVSVSKKKVGALPIGFSGIFLDISFKITNQFDIYNNVSAIVEDTKTGSTITILTGKGSGNDNTNAFLNYANRNSNESIKDWTSVKSRINKFMALMQKEVKDYNAGKTETIKKQPITIMAKKKAAPKRKAAIKKAAPKRKAAVKKAAPKRKVAVKKAAPKRKVAVKKAIKQTGTSNIFYDKLHQAKRPGKRTTSWGTTYYESRENRSDKGRLLGIKIGSIPTYTDKDAAREIQLFADNDYQLYNQRRRPILINLGKKYKKGTYDIQKAAKLWRYYIDAAMQKYNKEFGSRGDKWFELLSVPDRNLLALEYAMETKDEFDLGNFTS